MKMLLFILLLVSAVFGTQYVPIPKKQIGMFTPNSNAEVEIELLYDPICDNTAQFDQKFQQMYNSLSEQEKSKIQVKYILFALPFHLSSQKITQGIIFVYEKKGLFEALKLMRQFLATKEDWYEKKVRQQSVQYLMNRIAEKIKSMFGMKLQDVVKQLQHGSKTDLKARQWSKMVMGAMKAAGTPRLIINRSTVDDAMFLTVQKMKTLIKSLLVNSEINQN